MNSSFLSLDWKDLLKTFITTVIGTVLMAALTGLEATPPHFPTGPELLTALKLGLAAGAAYLIRKLLTNSQDEFLKKDPKQS